MSPIAHALATLDAIGSDRAVAVALVALFVVVLVGCDFQRPGVRGVWRDAVRRRDHV